MYLTIAPSFNWAAKKLSVAEMGTLEEDLATIDINFSSSHWLDFMP
jgi:isocitrate lyase